MALTSREASDKLIRHRDHLVGCIDDHCSVLARANNSPQFEKDRDVSGDRLRQASATFNELDSAHREAHREEKQQAKLGNGNLLALSADDEAQIKREKELRALAGLPPLAGDTPNVVDELLGRVHRTHCT